MIKSEYRQIPVSFCSTGHTSTFAGHLVVLKCKHLHQCMFFMPSENQSAGTERVKTNKSKKLNRVLKKTQKLKSTYKF